MCPRVMSVIPQAKREKKEKKLEDIESFLRDPPDANNFYLRREKKKKKKKEKKTKVSFSYSISSIGEGGGIKRYSSNISSPLPKEKTV